jgi:hypothetical protein
VGEEGRQAGVGVSRGVRTVGDELFGCTKLGVGSMGSEGSQSDLSAAAQRR